MSKQNGRPDILLPSNPDLAELAAAVEGKFLELCQFHRRVAGFDLAIPEWLRQDALRWRRMVLRHRHGDFRHTSSEKKSTRAVAEWTLSVNCKLRNQVYVPMVWRD